MGPLHYDRWSSYRFLNFGQWSGNHRDGDDEYLLVGFMGSSGLVNRLIH